MLQYSSVNALMDMEVNRPKRDDISVVVDRVFSF